jgi:hypothetical protein
MSVPPGVVELHPAIVVTTKDSSLDVSDRESWCWVITT